MGERGNTRMFLSKNISNPRPSGSEEIKTKYSTKKSYSTNRS